MTAGKTCKDCKAAGRLYIEPPLAPYPGPRCAEHWQEWTKKRERCIDCPADARPRPTKRPGPRCATHMREFKRHKRDAAHEATSVRAGMQPGDYGRLLAYQGGRCALCGRAKGTTKRLAREHDHKSKLLRGLVCTPCNDVLAHARDDVEFFERVIAYLKNPPAQQMGMFRYINEDVITSGWKRGR